jgi:hypothetical protein
MTAGQSSALVANAEAEQESARVGVGEGSTGIHHRGGIPCPDNGDARGQDHAIGCA